ncbi:ATP-binding protein [Nostoc sp. CCY 9925]|uniref:ATP-binding protein n=1 Tax=Nostoc sp. CCY 9925 TaxID=3103865 RepID=UPI0039C71778
MARSLKVAEGYIASVRSALQRNGYPSQNSLACEVGISLSTIKNFLNGKPVDILNFQEICQKLGLEWQKISVHSEETVTESSIFITGKCISDPRYFFGREEELKRLFNLLKKRPLQNAVIIGKKLSGKTSLLYYLKNITTIPKEKLRPGQKSDWLPQPEIYKWVFVNFQDTRMQKQEGLLKYILQSLAMEIPSICDLDHFMEIVSDNLHQPTVILMDQVEVGLQRCPELDDGFWECLRSLGNTSGNLSFVLSTPKPPLELAHSNGHSSPFFNTFGYMATLSAFTEQEAQKLIASSPISFSETDIEWILKQSQCVPLLLQILCWHKLFSLENGEIGDNWQEEGLQQIKQFQFLLAEL